MQRISSRTTFFIKRVFPVIWFGFLIFFVVVTLVKGPRGSVPVGFYLFPVLMGVFGYFIMRKLVFDLADVVYDAGDALVVRFGSDEERIPLSEIVNVSYSYMMNPPRITLTLRNPGNFGKEVSFSPPSTFVPFSKSPVVADLIDRVDAARRG